MKKEDDCSVHIKEENLRDGSETDQERGMKENIEKKEGRETEREEHHSTGDSSKEVRKAGYLPSSSSSFGLGLLEAYLNGTWSDFFQELL